MHYVRGAGDRVMFLALLSAAMEREAPGGGWTVAQGADGHVCVSSSAPFVLFGGQPDAGSSDAGTGDGPRFTWSDGYGPRTAGRVLGLARGPLRSAPDPRAAGRHVATAPHRPQLDVEECIYLHLEDFEATESSDRASGQGAALCHEVLGVHERKHTEPVVKRFSPSLSRLKRVRARFVDYYGQTMRFRNADNSLSLSLSLSIYLYLSTASGR